MPSLKLIVALIFVAVSGFLTWGCEKPARNEASTSTTTKPTAILTVAYLPYTSALPFFVGLEQGLFDAKGVKVVPIKTASANEAMDALKAGRVDCAVGVGLSTCFALEQASPGSLKLFQPCGEDDTHWVSYLLVPKSSTLKGPEQLKGKRVGTYSGTSQQLVLRLLLQKMGLKPGEDVTLGNVATNLQIDALAAGQFDAFLMLEPYATRAVRVHGCRVLVDNPRVKHILNPFPAGANATTPHVQEQKGPALAAFVAAMDGAVDFIEAHEQEAKTLLPRYDPSLNADIAANSRLYRWWRSGETEAKGLQRYCDLLVEGGELKQRLNIDALLLKK